jgi:integrase
MARGRPTTGHLRREQRRDGLTTFSLRVRAYGHRYTVRLGNELDGWSEARATIELENVTAQIQAGIWEPPATTGDPTTGPPTFHEYASLWLKRRVAEGIAENTRKDYLWQLSNHLLPFFGGYLLSDLSERLVEEFKDRKLEERARVLAARDAGIQLQDGNGNARRPLSNTSINKFLVLLTRILEAAVKHGWLAANPAARVERLKVRRRKGSILEADELESLILAAGPRDPGASTTARRVQEVRRLRDDHHLSWREIATRLEIASSTAVYCYRRPESSPTEEDGRRALIAALGCGGLRASEAANLNVGDIDLLHGKLHVRDSKTEAGMREVDMTPRLINEVRRYLATRPNASPEEPAFPTRTGGRRDKDNIRSRVVAPILDRANAQRQAADLPPIGIAVTPHTLRRTYISLMLSAGAEVPYVQAQVGHADPKITLEIYAIVLKRRERRQFAAAFDALMQDAIPSMQQARMQDVGRPTPDHAATPNTGIAA